MEEYIKREDALDAVLFALVGTGYQSNAIWAIRGVETADVVPRSELELNEKAYESLKQLYDNDTRELSDNIERLISELEQAKQKVAREIFDKMISDTNLAISYVKNTKFYTEEIRKVKLECYRDVLGYFAELEKEYLGEEK